VLVRTLQNLGLYEVKDLKVGSPLNKKISGGQRKRLNIALELIREPTILFLDEHTSGLSSRDSENIMDLLKELTTRGKLVFVVIHQPSSDIFKMFDKLTVLDQGGYLIYHGDPVDSISYFKSQTKQANWRESECQLCGNVNPEQIFNIVEAQVIDEYGNLTRTRKTTAKEWHEYYLDTNTEKKQEVNTSRKLPEIQFKVPGKFKQFMVFVQRDVLSKLANTQYIFINLLEAPVLAFILSYIIKYYNIDTSNEQGYTFMENSNVPVYLFMSVIVAIFIGLTVSAQEIIKDRKILKRETFLNLSRTSYLLSKVAILFLLSAIQSLSYVLIGNTIVEVKGMYLEYWLVLFSTWCFANLLGMNISDGFKSSVTIHIVIPFLIIPQIVLSGIIVKFDKINPNISSPDQIPFYGELITARWAYESLAVRQFVSNRYRRGLYNYDKVISKATYRRNYWQKTLAAKLSFCVNNQNVDDESVREDFLLNLEVLRNEIEQELALTGDKIPFENLDELHFDRLTLETFDAVRSYLVLVDKYYIKLAQSTRQKKNEYVNKLQRGEGARDRYVALKRDYSNDGLEEFVTNRDEIKKIVEYKGRLYQKIDPIYQDPALPLLKAHFYAPRKQLFGNYYSTFWVNVWVIWGMILLLYIALYFQWLKKSMDWFEHRNLRIPLFKKS